MSHAPHVIGRRTPRIDGRAKLTGRADYTGDHRLEDMLHGYPVPASIAHGRLEALELDAARAMPGVVDIFHHGHFPDLHRSPNSMRRGDPVSEVRLPFEDDRIHYHGQYIALVVAETFAQARAAAFEVKARYHREAGIVTGLGNEEGEEVRHYARGEPEIAFGLAPVILDKTYTMAAESHVPLEPHVTLAEWREPDPRLVVHESTQGVFYQRNALARIFDLPPERVEVISHYIGSGFGNKLFMWPHAVATAAAARWLGRPVRTVLPRAQDMMTTGHRPASRQHLRLGAELDGTLVSIRHDSLTETSMVDRYIDACGNATPSAYACDNVATRHRLLRVHRSTPCPMRAPGEASGLFALESAMDELAEALDMDPLALRLKNYAHRDPQRDLPWSSKHLDRCLESAAERFGWATRDPRIGAMRDGDEIIGQGMAAAGWFAGRQSCAARVALRADGSVVAACGTQDIGTGTYTVVAQTVAELTGVPVSRIAVRLGETRLPEGPISGGSMTTASTLPAIAAATRDALATLKATAAGPGGAFAGLDAAALEVDAGALVADGRRAAFAEILTRQGLDEVTGEGHAAPGDERQAHSFRSFGAHFVEVRWDPGIARLRVARVVSAIDVGRAINPVTARHQVEGAIVMGLGMALLEGLHHDPRDARLVNANVADYRMPVQADMPEIDVELLDYPDFRFNEFGARGIGEIGLTGLAAAIANAVRHATGRRIRDLPITVEKLLAPD